MYTVKITKQKVYQKKNYKYEGDNGIRYNSEYGIPEGVKIVRKEYETGETGTTVTDVYEQTVDELALIEVIKAVNSFK